MDRALKRRDAVLNTVPRICPDRARFLTEAYMANENLPMILRRADAFRNVLEKMTIYIASDELIVGNQASSPRAAPLFPEYGAHWIIDELDSFENRPYDKFEIDEDTKKELRSILPYWYNKSYYDKVRSLAEITLSGNVRECFDFEYSNLNQVISNPGQIFSGAGHVTPDFEKVLRLGLRGIIDEVKRKLDTVEPCSAEGLKKNLFYRAVLITLEAAVAFARRFSLKASRMSLKESDPRRRSELQKIASVCKRVPEHPARNLHEALQATWFVHLMLQIESNGHSMSLGRMDQYLYPFYEEDLEKGIITPEQALTLLELFMVKCFEVNKLRCWVHSQYVAGYPMFQQITLGGQSPDGKDAANDLSYLFLKALAAMGLSQPSVSVRIFKGTSSQFLQAAVQTVVNHRGGLPSFFNDEVVIALLLNIGLKLKEARNWSVMGCAEPQVMGKFLPGVSACHINLLKILELTLNGGVNPSTGRQLYPSKGTLSSYGSLDEILSAYKELLERYVEFALTLDNFAAMVQEEIMQTPFLSSFIEHRIEMGKDVTETAGKTYANQVILGHGSVNVGNALAAIGKLIYEEKVLEPEALMEALLSNFKGPGQEAIRQMLLNRAPKYGNDDEYVDELTRETLNYFLKKCHCMRHYWGGRYGPTPQGVSANVPLGAAVGATPDGRKAGQPLADNTSPAAGTDLKGPTAVLKSVARLDHELASNGTILNLKLHPSALKNREGMDKFASLIRTFFNMSGMQVQFNIITAEELKEAQKNPEAYRNLVVKVAGYSAHFTSLDRRLQDQIIERTTHLLP
ncbi:MAG: glycyl radical protein [Deltaproteobacteria bacterium]|nr:glycyl radical protein [Deltaproteobacteria bacterium]MBW1960858.1 glycyl radical protein [Deltaproteobacteria bacterium]MBW1993510.1 glycyl radical protein [Deltaproteobacteria bacterium]MBW2150726.1 glycyl radical protein [Deltaproteobacteria bacterium]